MASNISWTSGGGGLRGGFGDAGGTGAGGDLSVPGCGIPGSEAHGLTPEARMVLSMSSGSGAISSSFD